MIKSVAVVGIGAMGAPMARRILDAGFDLIICDRKREALEPLAALGAIVAEDPAQCATADMVIVLVATPQQMQEVLLGDEGVIAGATADHKPLVAVMSTVSGAILKDVAVTLGYSGVALIDAPVSGGIIRAKNGSLAILLGGRDQDIARALPVFEAVGDRLCKCGDVGSAQTVKLLNNMISAASTLLSAEIFCLADQMGLDLITVARAMEVSTGRNYLTKDPEGIRHHYATLASSKETFLSVLSIVSKDVALAVDLLAEAEGEYPAMRGMLSLVGTIGDETYINWKQVTDGICE